MKQGKKPYASFAAQKEALSRMRVNLDFIDFEKKLKCLMITSAVQDEGKSFVAAQLARSLSESDRRILLIDADMRNSTQNKLFSLPNRKGLSWIFSHAEDWQDCINETGNDNLLVISSGRTPPNPAELLSSSKMQEILYEMRQYFNIILIDTPPILPVPDAIALSHYVDGILLVTRYGKTTKQNVEEAKRALTLANAPLVGAVLNDVYSYEHQYYYN